MAQNTILIVGDSISAAYGLDIKQGWVTLLQEKLRTEKYNYKVINASISGDTTSNGLTRLPVALKQYQPTITIIELGGNDGLRGLDTEVIQNNLSQMVTLAKQANSKVLILGLRMPPNYGPAYTEKFKAIFTTVASQQHVKVVPDFLTIVAEKNLFQGDNIHPTAEAQQLILTNVWSELKGML